MSRPITKDDVILNKKESIKQLNRLLESYISSPTHLKKANLISYWLKSYCEYLRREETFDSKRMIAYKRGDVIKADFGFNIGSEHGGLHYAVVLDVNNKHSSPVVTVLPLSSGTESSVYERDVYLGNELYTKVSSKHKLLYENAKQKLEQANQIIEALSQANATSVDELLLTLKAQQDELEQDVEQLKKYRFEINNMKQGSIAMMEQITTISKMRIYIPRKSSDILYGISFSPTAMDKINKQLQTLFIGNAEDEN